MSERAWTVLFEKAGVPHDLAKKHAKKFHKHGMEITLIPDLKNRLQDCLREDAEKRKIESAKFVEKYFQDLRAKEAEEKKKEQNLINAKPTANHITIDSGDDESVDDEAFTQFKKSMDFYVSVKEAEKEKDRAIFMKKKIGQLEAKASKDKEHDHTERTATPITIDLESDLESEDCVVIEASASDLPKRAAIRFRSDLCANDAKNKKKQSNVGGAANPITIGSDSESEDSVKIEAFLGISEAFSLKRASSLLDISNFGPKVLTSRKKSKTG